MALNPRQQKFVEEYLRCGNGAEAYRRAGYECKTPQIAAVGGDRLLRNTEICAAIASARAQLQEEGIVTTREVWEGLKREAKGRKGSKAADRIASWKFLAELLGMVKEAELRAEMKALEAFGEDDSPKTPRRAPTPENRPATSGATECLPE